VIRGDSARLSRYNPRLPGFHAGLAQLVVHLICNQGVGGSSPSAGTIAPSADIHRRS
jgi:hypothetical protein